MIEGWYYLHTNGDVIFKKGLPGIDADIRESTFAVGLWTFRGDDREQAWEILVEALAGGAREERIAELAKLWNCNDEDALVYAGLVGCLLYKDGDKCCATRTDFTNIALDPIGFGNTYLEAMAELAKVLGFFPSKMWRKTFKDLLAGEYKKVTEGLQPG